MITLLEREPSLFDFSILSYESKIGLLRADAGTFLKHIDPAAFRPADKLRAMNDLPKTITRDIVFTEAEIHNLRPYEYYHLLCNVSFDKYIRAPLFDKLDRQARSELYIRYPEWVIANATVPKLTSCTLATISSNKPAFISKYVTDFTGLSTTSNFWNTMICYDRTYAGVFLKNINTCVTKTDIREVFHRNPALIRRINSDIISNSKLSAKEWLLMIRAVTTRCAKQFEGWSLPAALVDDFRLDLTAEMLNGKSTLTRQFQNAAAMLDIDHSAENENPTTI